MNAAVQTFAPADEFDMFGGAPAQAVHVPCDELVIEIHGVLVSPAEVRSKPIGDGSHMRPVLCLDVRPLNNGLKRRIHAEQIFTEATRKDAEAKAATLKKGSHITLTTSLRDMRTTLPHVQSVVLHPAEHHV